MHTLTKWLRCPLWLALLPASCASAEDSGNAMAMNDAPAPSSESPSDSDGPTVDIPPETPEVGDPSMPTPDLDVDPGMPAPSPEPPTAEPALPEPSAAMEPAGAEPGAEPSAEPSAEPAMIPAEPAMPANTQEPTPAEPAMTPVEPTVEPAAEPVPDYPPGGEYGELAELPEANSEMAVAEVLGIIYVLGGYPSSREVQTTVQAYDAEADSWSVVAPLPTPLHHPVAVGYEGKLYSLGGQVSQGANPDTDRTLVYDPAADEWSDLAPMPTARGAGAAAIVDGKIYVVGGRPEAQNAFEAYDVASDSWETLPDLPTTYNNRNHLAATAIDGRVYVAGGRYDGGGFQSPMTDSLDIFDPATSEWSLGAPMLRPRGGVNAVAAHGCLHVFGGEGSGIGEPNDVFPDHDIYDPTTDTWTALPPLPVPVHGVTGAVFLNGLIYMPGGGTTSGGSSGSTLFQVYHPTTRCD